MGLEFGARTGKWSSRNMETGVQKDCVCPRDGGAPVLGKRKKSTACNEKHWTAVPAGQHSCPVTLCLCEQHTWLSRHIHGGLY